MNHGVYKFYWHTPNIFSNFYLKKFKGFKKYSAYNGELKFCFIKLIFKKKIIYIYIYLISQSLTRNSNIITIIKKKLLSFSFYVQYNQHSS